MDRLVKVIRKLEVLEVSHIDFYSHASLINNIASEDKLEILAEFDNSSSTEAKCRMSLLQWIVKFCQYFKFVFTNDIIN